MNQKHWMLMIAGCALPVFILAGVLVLQLQINPIVLFGIVLLCPLAHLFMMRGPGHQHLEDHDG